MSASLPVESATISRIVVRNKERTELLSSFSIPTAKRRKTKIFSAVPLVEKGDIVLESTLLVANRFIWALMHCLRIALASCLRGHMFGMGEGGAAIRNPRKLWV